MSRASPFVLAVVSLVFTATIAGQGIRVSAPLPRDRQSAESVEDFRVGSGGDSDWAVFVATPEDPSRTEVFSVPVAGGPWRRLSTENAWSYGPRIGAGRVVFLSTGGLQAAPFDGSAPAVVLHPPLAGYVRAYEIAAAAARVVYIADASEPGRIALHSAPLDGGGPAVELASSLAAGGDVLSFEIAPDGATVVFRADRLVDEVYELWSVPTDGSAAPRRLSPPLAAGSDVSERYEITADGARAVFVADVSAPLEHELWSAPLDGSAPAIRLDGPSLLGGVTLDALPTFRLTPDGAHVVFRAHRATDEIVQLYVVPADGGAPLFRIGGPVEPGGGVLDLYPIPPGGRVAYLVVPAGGASAELRSAALDGSVGVRLNAPLAPFAGFSSVAVGADGLRVAYACDQDVDGRFDLWSAPMDGSTPAVRLAAAEHVGGDVLDVVLAGARVVYRGDIRVDERFELWSVPAAGGAAPRRLSGVLQPHGDVAPRVIAGPGTLGFELAAGGTRVVYRADASMDESFELWSAPLDGSAAPFALSMPLDPGDVWDDVLELAWSHDGRRLLHSATDRTSSRTPSSEVYSADMARLDVDGRIPSYALGGSGQGLVVSPDDAWVAFSETRCDVDACTAWLRCAPLDGSASPRVFFSQDGYVSDYRFDADGSRLVFRFMSYLGPYSTSGLASIPSDGGSDVVLLSIPGPGAFVSSYELVADGRVVFQQGHLYTVPATGGVPVALEPPELGPGDLREFRASPDGREVVFAGQLSSGTTHGLFAAKSDGSRPAVRLDPSAPPNSVLAVGLEIDPAGERVVYVRDRELLSSPTDPARGGVILRLSAKAVPGGGVALPGGMEPRPQFAIASDGSRVAYRADADGLGRCELFSVPLDGGAEPVRLHAPLSAAQGVVEDAFAFAGAARVVFIADLAVSGRRELFAAPADGGGPPIPLSGPFPDGGDLRSPTPSSRDAFAVSPDGLTVAYLADALVPGTTELFAVPSDGSRAPRRLNRELVPGGQVGLLGEVRSPFAFSPDGRLVAYLADQEVLGVVELFVSYVDPPRVRRAPAPRPLF